MRSCKLRYRCEHFCKLRFRHIDINTRINDLEVYDGIRASTNLHAGLVKIQNDLQSSDKNSIVFVLSDGKST